MRSHGDRADGFYKVLTLVGLLMLVSGAELGVWNVHRSEERIFKLQGEVTVMATDANHMRADIRHTQNSVYDARERVRSAGRGTARYYALVEEAEKTSKRLEQERLDLRGLSDSARTKYHEMGALKVQSARDLWVGLSVGVLGLILTVTGFSLWYWLVQRFLQIETQARMTTHLVEEVVTRSRSEAVLARLDFVETPAPPVHIEEPAQPVPSFAALLPEVWSQAVPQAVPDVRPYRRRW